MCLYYSSKKTKEIRERLEQGKTTFWKVYLHRYNRLFPIHYQIRDNKSKTGVKQIEVTRAGFIVSNRTSTTMDFNEKEHNHIYKGIHVFIDKREAEMYKNKIWEVVIPVEARLENFVGAGESSDAVFMKVKIPQHIIKKYKIKKKR